MFSLVPGGWFNDFFSSGKVNFLYGLYPRAFQKHAISNSSAHTWDTWCLVSRTPGRGVYDTYLCLGSDQIVRKVTYLSAGLPLVLSWYRFSYLLSV
jgi:hypothetical protein